MPKQNWTQDEIDYLIQNRALPRKILAKHLGRSYLAISHKTERLGLRRPQRNPCKCIKPKFNPATLDGYRVFIRLFGLMKNHPGNNGKRINIDFFELKKAYKNLRGEMGL